MKSDVLPVQKPFSLTIPYSVGYIQVKEWGNLKREFVMMPEFDRQWKAMGLTDENLKELQFELLNEPTKAPVIKGTGGLRKVRISLPGRGKRGSARVAYVDFAMYETIYLITAYAKNKKETLSNRECAIIKAMIAQLEEALRIRRNQ